MRSQNFSRHTLLAADAACLHVTRKRAFLLHYNKLVLVCSIGEVSSSLELKYFVERWRVPSFRHSLLSLLML